MTDDRVIDEEFKPEELEIEVTLRPATLDEFIGQTEVKENLKVSIEAALGRKEWPLDARYEITITMHEHDRRSRDWDNVKGVCDGLTGIVWNDDRQIDRAHVYRGEVRKSAPCVVVAVEVIA